MAGQSSSDPRRARKRLDRSEMPVTFLPVGNRKARVAYLCAVFGLIPVVGLICGPAAVIFGRMGYLDAKKDPDHKGIGHSFASMVLGTLETLTNAIGIPLVARGLGWF